MRGTVVFDFDDTLADTKAFKKALDVARMRAYVFPDAPSVLRRLKRDGWKIALLTVGDPGWQAWKVACSGLLPLFDHVLYTAEPKTSRLREILSWPAPLVFVNDDGREIDAFRRTLPKARMLAVRGPKPLPTDPSAIVCESLEEVYSRVATG